MHTVHFRKQCNIMMSMRFIYLVFCMKYWKYYHVRLTSQDLVERVFYSVRPGYGYPVRISYSMCLFQFPKVSLGQRCRALGQAAFLIPELSDTLHELATVSKRWAIIHKQSDNHYDHTSQIWWHSQIGDTAKYGDSNAVLRSCAWIDLERLMT